MPATKTVEVTKCDDVPKESVDGLPTLVYWGICGLAQPCRYAMELSGVDYVDVRIDAGVHETPEYKTVWTKAKADVGTVVPFVNLPYCLDGDTKFSQSNAILRYAGSLLKGGENLLRGDATRLNVALEQATDFDNSVTRPCYGDVTVLVAKLNDGAMDPVYAQWSNFLGNHAFLAGPDVTIADCKFYEVLRKVSVIAKEFKAKDPLDNCPALKAYVDRFESLPKIKAYQASPAFHARPLNNPQASFK